MLTPKNYTDRLIRSGGLMNTKQTAKALGVSERTIIRWRSAKINLDYAMIAGQARYEPMIVEAFKESQTIRVASFQPDSHQNDDA